LLRDAAVAVEGFRPQHRADGQQHDGQKNERENLLRELVEDGRGGTRSRTFMAEEKQGN
jgi:hypothetical protein